jgi:predicted AAA+ superfamily ATPase
MLGRRRLIEQIERHVLKPSPDHVQVVGPRLFGKSVLLKTLADRYVMGNAHYTTAAYVDLRHAPPVDDAAAPRDLTARL